MDRSLPGSSVYGISQTRILELVVMTSSRDLPNPGIEPMPHASFALAGRFVTAKGYSGTPWERASATPNYSWASEKNIESNNPRV